MAARHDDTHFNCLPSSLC